MAVSSQFIPDKERKTRTRTEIKDSILRIQPGFKPKFARSRISTAGVIKMFTLVKDRNLFTGDPNILDFSVKMVQMVMKPILDGARSRGPYKYSDLDLNLKGSAGEPVSSCFGVHTKQAALNSKAASEYLVRSIEERFPAIYKVSGKDEYLPSEKVELDKFRTFEISPMGYLIKMMTWLQPLADEMSSRDDYLWSSYGIALQHGGWRRLMQRMRSNNPKFFYSSDVEKWDKHVIDRKSVV